MMIVVKQGGQQSMQHTERRILVRSYATGPVAGFAFLVRGSSRRITTMMAGRKARSTNIRVINRRNDCFDFCPVCFIKRKKQKQKALLGKSLT
jgi:hypothetical protein